MDPERVPPRSQAEMTSPAHGTGEDNSEVDTFNPSHKNVPRAIARIDSSNVSPSARHLLSSASSEKSEVHETSSLHHQSNSDHLKQPIKPPLSVRLPESISGRRETRLNTDNRFPSRQEIDWIVPTGEEKVSKRFFFFFSISI